MPSPSASLVESGSELHLSGPPQSKVAPQGRSTSQFKRSAKVVVAVLIMWPSIQRKCESISWIKSKCPACLSDKVNPLAGPNPSASQAE